MLKSEYPDHIIAIRGPIGSGKTTLRRWIEETYHFSGQSLSDELREMSAEQQADATVREDLLAFGLSMRKLFGSDILIRRCIEKWRAQRHLGLAAGVLVIEGHWSAEEADAGKDAGMQYIDLEGISAKKRFDRIQERFAAADTDTSWESFHAIDLRGRFGLDGPNTPYDQPAFRELDDYSIDASRSPDEVYAQVDQCIVQVLESPTASEKRAARPKKSHDEVLRNAQVRTWYAEEQVRIEQQIMTSH